MNPYQAFPHLNLPPSPAGRPAPAGVGGGLWSSILIFRLFSAAEAFARGLARAVRTR
jgi:hypothetical protein